MTFTRRRFAATSVIGSAMLGIAGASSVALPASGSERTFAHGVASGDPLRDRVILWTRVTPSAPDAPVRVRWRIASDPALRNIVNQGELMALAARDFTVKVDTLGLDPGRTYYYQFDAQGQASPIGRTRTLPSGAVTQTRLAVVSCSNMPFGFFNAYAAIAARFDLDAVLHLGDYFYEYGPNDRHIDAPPGRDHTPAHELLTLADYRGRHAQYKTDIDLQAAHRQHPWITVWDDHESANDSWTGGAQNHNPEKGDGDWAARKTAATRAYAEWMPIRERSESVV